MYGYCVQVLMAVVPIVVPVIFTLVIIIGFVGNLLVVLVVILNKKMRNTTNILIFNLAVMLQPASNFDLMQKFAILGIEILNFIYLYWDIFRTFREHFNSNNTGMIFYESLARTCDLYSSILKCCRCSSHLAPPATTTWP